jgi:predicted RNA-binding Zn ribbon-like protein
MKKDQAAPGSLEKVRLFVNTTSIEDSSRDVLGTPERAVAWLRANGMDYGPIDAGEAEQLRSLREALRTVLLAHTGKGDADSAEGALSRELAGSPVVWAPAPDGTLVLEPRGANAVERIRSAFAIAIYDAVAVQTWGRLKACHLETCRDAFFDRSKNGSGAWCDMAVCGNRVKAAKRREQQRAGAK